MRRDRWNVKFSLRDRYAIKTENIPRAENAGRIGKVQMILNNYGLPAGIVSRPQRPMYIFVFLKTCMRCPVGIDQAVKAEVAVMLQFSVISAVPIHRLSVRSHALHDSVIAPFPYESAAQGRIFLSQITIFFKISRAVAHRMAIFDKQQRLFRLVIQIIGYL